MSADKSEAQRLADALQKWFPTYGWLNNATRSDKERLAQEAAALLRRWPDGEPVAWREHVEQRLRSWRQSQMNRSGDRLALGDFMGEADIEDLIDWVCDEYAGPSAPPDQSERIAALEDENARLLAALNTPELHDFAKAVALEGAHQRLRWGAAHDEGKSPEDWFWTLGYLGGKALAAVKAGDIDKALHHTITAAALLANWHAAIDAARSKT